MSEYVANPLPVATVDLTKQGHPEKATTLDSHNSSGLALGHGARSFAFPSTQSVSSYATPVTTPLTSVSSQLGNDDVVLPGIDRYIALGCLHFERPVPITIIPDSNVPKWVELLFAALPNEVKVIIGLEASRLLEAGWIRLFLHQPDDNRQLSRGIIRVYLLPEDWGRRSIDRRSKSLKSALRDLLHRIDVSPEAWFGDQSEAEIHQFDPWFSAENVSLYYLFNKLPSPAPSAEMIKNRYSRNAVWGLLDSVSTSIEDSDEQSMNGLKTRLYPYQARSASLMIQREAAPQLHLDPRLEIRTSPTGENIFFGARDGSFLKEPRFYESNRGGILAETMGLGKTIICLALILATKGHLPQIPPGYQMPPPVRNRVGSLANMAANIIGRYAIPGKAYLEQIEALENINLNHCKQALQQNIAHYEIPVELPRMNRTTRIPPPRELVMCGGTIVVVPRNLLHQWQAEIRKHVLKGSLNILVMDSKPKRAPKQDSLQDGEVMDISSELPSTTDLMNYDIILFTRNRFEQEIVDGADKSGRRFASGAPLICQCSYIGATRIRDCNCLTEEGVYESPLKKLHWLRIIIDEGHNFSSGVSNAVLVAKQLQVERRWVVSGTPAKNLVGVEVDLSMLDQDETDPALLRELAVEQRKTFSLDDESTKAVKALGSLASNFLMVRPWSDSPTEGKLEWDDYIYRHEHQHRKTYNGFSSCFLRTLEGLVVKTQPEDVDRDIQLPPMRHRTVYLEPCWYDKMIANLFIQVLRANAITSERSDADYLFHKSSAQARHSLLRNLRQSAFTWTGFSLDDIASTLETSSKYLGKEDKNCSIEDATLLLESSRIVSDLISSAGWIALSKSHEVGMAVERFPESAQESFSVTHPEQPSMIGITQLLEGQSHVDSQILLEDPSQSLDIVGRAARAKILAAEEAEHSVKRLQEKESKNSNMARTGVPSSCVGGQPLTSRRTAAIFRGSQQKVKGSPTQIKSEYTPSATPVPSEGSSVGEMPATPASPVRPKKRRLTLVDEKAELPSNSSLRETCLVGTTSAKLTYLIDMVVKHQAEDKIIIFYDGDNAAYYIAQCLEMLYINHRIYARTLDNTKRSQYVALFNEDPDVRVLLIDVACGALGLNLNAASIVLIVNPINRPSIEAQAIKRAHRIGQTKEVLVETLVLQGTIEEAIFKRAKRMSRMEHQEAKTLEDDNQIIDIIQNAAVLPVTPEESRGRAQFALLETPQQVFGRPGREKYHKVGHVDTKNPGKPKKRARTMARGLKKEMGVEAMPILGPAVARMQPLAEDAAGAPTLDSVFGVGSLFQAS